MKISKILLTICLSFVFFGYGQNRLTGKVVDFNNKPVAKAKIYLDSIYSKVTTDKNGDFEVSIPAKVGTINVYSHEYGLLSSKYNNENKMSFVFLEADQSKKTEKGNDVSIAYSKSEDKYVAKSQGKSTQSDKSNYNTIYDMIRGKVAGVTVSRDHKITIQGVSSINYASEPLFVVDGMIVSNIDYLIPNNVKSIRVLKGAEASYYGSQGSSGVIVITTIK
ncbi:TonB-dependent SusC/RagA subfamily outer membrane receptor [Flavobacterium sp. 103]|uniref:TonB-dependent receptor plug domain-containing protein n=1 Tax=Flavobacterium sp. 103 TaxID=2135624 RepID=UPI000D5D6507|nr:TonB-dependent receptor plug domain-containing protein [Flavobacterium sp. 103]PVX46482.1 TonB-dependent SusC/RagA subfamily outer membrane receptor [Flavobacterium sp. 103]